MASVRHILTLPKVECQLGSYLIFGNINFVNIEQSRKTTDNIIPSYIST